MTWQRTPKLVRKPARFSAVVVLLEPEGPESRITGQRPMRREMDRAVSNTCTR